MAKKYRPRELRINPYTIPLKYDLNGDNVGEYCPLNIQIHLKKGLKDQQLKSTIVHEIYHHVLEPMTFLKPDEEESLCRVLERVFLSLVRDNKKLIAWIQEQDEN